MCICNVYGIHRYLLVFRTGIWHKISIFEFLFVSIAVEATYAEHALICTEHTLNSAILYLASSRNVVLGSPKTLSLPSVKCELQGMGKISISR